MNPKQNWLVIFLAFLAAVASVVAMVWLPGLAFALAAGSLALALCQPDAPRRRGREPRA